MWQTFLTIHIPVHYTTHLPVRNVVMRENFVANKKIYKQLYSLQNLNLLCSPSISQRTSSL